MPYLNIEYPVEKTAFYALLAEQINHYTAQSPIPASALANAAAVISDAMEDINWAGFYIVQGRRLVLGPFQGKPAAMEIPYAQGVCGKSWRDGGYLLVPDVHSFPGHIACDCDSNAELVIPIFGSNGQVVGVMDIDSPVIGRFDEADVQGLKRAADLASPFVEAIYNSIQG